jgi:preprotein translocase subunit SecE
MSEQDSLSALETTGQGGDAVAVPGNEGFFGRVSKFWREVREEMKRVSWPSFEDVKKTTAITLAAVIFFAIYLFAVDKLVVLLGRFGNWLLSLVGLA